LEQAGFLPMKDKMAKKKQAGSPSGQNAQPLSAKGAASPGTQPSCNILFVHEVVPHTDRNGTDTRLKQILKELRAQGTGLHLSRETGRTGKSMLQR
jgi:hypothetical protein